ncbi:hypothetical protein [Streptomyces sp. NPDC058252]|uniref:hypothetical protein n=1 Tax=Streptomyces sp. NPDC058252 TaxID=3346405 RepID=UPI0036EC187D
MGSFYGNVLVARAYEEVVPLLAAAAEVERAAGVMGEWPEPVGADPDVHGGPAPRDVGGRTGPAGRGGAARGLSHPRGGNTMLSVTEGLFREVVAGPL